MTERTISNDLAALGALDGRDLIELDRVDAFAASRTVAVAPVTPPSLSTLFALAAVHTRRAGRVGGGAVTLAFAVLVVTISWCVIAGVDFEGVPWSNTQFDDLLAAAMLTAIVGYAAGCAFARRRFDRTVGAAADGLQAARTLAGRRATASLALAVAGPSALAIVIGKLVLTLGIYGPQMDWLASERLAAVNTDMVLQTTVAIVIAFAIATVLARAIVRGWPRQPFAVGAAGFTLGVVTLMIGLTYDVGRVIVVFMGGGTPSPPFRIALTAAGSLAVVLVFAAIAAARHRADQRIIDARTI